MDTSAASCSILNMKHNKGGAVAIFGQPMRTCSVQLPESAWKALDAEARRNRTTRADIVRRRLMDQKQLSRARK